MTIIECGGVALTELSIISQARRDYHEELATILTANEHGIPSNADSGSAVSIRFAQGIAERLGGVATGKKLKGQTLGARFEQATSGFLQSTFPFLSSIRPGDWGIRRIGDNSQPGFTTREERIAASVYEQYEHLDLLESIIKSNRSMQATLGNAYNIAPDVVVTRSPVSDREINRDHFVVDSEWGNLSSIRSEVQKKRLLHAVVSCKWTIRSDRAQNARSEALNLLRNRKGRAPHIVVVTAEPSPNRIASLALGTGDIDCVYHFALAELMDTIREVGDQSALEMIQMMVEGKRLKDISDLPLDLAV